MSWQVQAQEEVRRWLEEERAQREASVAELRAEVAELRRRLEAGAAGGQAGAKEADGAPEPPEAAGAAEAELLEPPSSTEHVLEESVWDASLFIGSSCVGHGASAMLIFLLLVNVITQGVFVTITINHFALPAIKKDDLVSIREWRQNTGHSYRFYDSMSSTSLVQRVCKGLPYLEMSNDRALAKLDMDQYWGSSSKVGEVLVSGPSMCLMALVCWYSTLLKELRTIFAIGMSLFVLPRGHTRVLCSGDGHRLASISWPRLGFAYGILAVRTTVAVLLGWYGTGFLVNTMSLNDLLLNAVALEVILNIDELLFAAFAPTCARGLLQGLQPLELPKLGVWRGGDALAAAWTAVLVLLLSLVGSLEISNLVGNIRDAREELCGGNQNFVYGKDALGIIFHTATLEGGLGAQSAGQQGPSPYRAAVNELIWGVPAGQLSMAYKVATTKVLGEFVNRRLPDQVDFLHGLYGTGQGLECADLVGRLPGLERYLTGGSNATCQGARSQCLTDSFVRACCPLTCGCDDPLSELLLSYPNEGCPGFCAHNAAYDAVLARAPCTEQTPEELRQDPVWQAWAPQFAVSAARFTDIGEPGVAQPETHEEWVQLLLDRGCRIVPWYKDWYDQKVGASTDPCAGIWSAAVGFQSLGALAAKCPLTCGCRAANASAALLAECPGSCSRPR